MVLAVIAAPATAVEKTLQNDSFSGTGSVTCVLGSSFAAGDIAAARFIPAPGDYPFQILEIHVLACPSGSQDVVALKIWEDDGFSNEPVDLLYEEFFTLVGSDLALNGLDVSTLGLVVNSGSIRIGIEYYVDWSPVGIATDMNGHVTPQPNFIYDFQTFGWRTADFFGVDDDWIIRVVIDANEAPPLFADGFESGDTTEWSETVE